MSDQTSQTETGPTSRRSRSLRKFILLLFLALMILVMVLLLFLLRFYRPFGQGPAGPVVDRTAFSEVWSERPVLLLGLGDSITAGFGVSENHGYFARLFQNPVDEFDEMKGICLKAVLPNLTAVNKSRSGSNSLEHLQYLESNATPYSADTFGIVVITTGGNDLIHFYGRTPPKEGAMYGAAREEARPWIEYYRKRLDSIVEKITGLFPGGCLIFLANIYDPTDNVGDAASVFLPAWPDGIAILAEYNQAIQDCVQSHPHVFPVPLYEGFLGHGTHCSEPWRKHYCSSDPTFWFGGNIEDPNIRGFDATRRLFLNEIVKQRNKIK